MRKALQCITASRWRGLRGCALLLPFLVASPLVQAQSRFSFGLYAGYAGGNQNLTRLFSTNVCCFGSVSGKPHGWNIGFDLTRWFDNGLGIRAGVEFDDPEFNNADYYNDLTALPVTLSLAYRKNRVYAGGGVGWYRAQFQEQSSAGPGPGYICVNGPCSDNNPTTYQTGHHFGYQGFVGLNVYRKLFLETRYSYAKVSSWDGGDIGAALESYGPINVGCLTISTGFRF